MPSTFAMLPGDDETAEWMRQDEPTCVRKLYLVLIVISYDNVLVNMTNSAIGYKSINHVIGRKSAIIQSTISHIQYIW